jgi:hypothetical protein
MGSLKTTLPAWQKTIIALTVAMGLASVGLASEDSDRDFEIKTVSSRPDTVSGGDAVVQVTLPRYARAGEVVLELNGVDVTSSFVADASGRRLTGLIAGMALGKNRLTTRAKYHHGGKHFAKLELVNYPSHGPVFSGAHQTPWICETAAAGLGTPPAEGPCVASTRTDWFYRTSTGTFAPLPSMAPPFPENLVQTTTIDGNTVPYIVRVESGTLDQNIYRIAILDDPTNPVRNPWSPGGKKPGAGWNGKLTVPFGGGCGPAYRSGSNNVTSALQNTQLSLGFAVAFGTRNTLGTGCNDLVSAETLMMIKERFIEQYGLPKYTVGLGSSGGAIQQHLIAHNYPGLMDAITPVRNYPDVLSVATDVIDCGLLNNYFATAVNPADWPGTRQSKVTGYPVDPLGRNNCVGWNAFARDWPGPTNGFDAVVPLEARYDPVTNPVGARGTLQDGYVNSLGINPQTGFARQPYDNIGVQYGLAALNRGDITKAEFLDLNERVGGLDIDGNLVAARSEGDLKGIENAYRHGRVNDGENLTLPIIQYRNYVDFANDIHSFHRSAQVLARMQKKNGTTDNVARWTMPQAGTVNFMRMALLAHDEWQKNLAADTSDAPYSVKVIRSKPASLKNQCWDASGAVVGEHPFNLDDPGACNQLFPVHADPRLVAGGPRSGDILKCSLKPVNFADYSVSFTGAEQARLKAIFPQGVCDWSRPGVKQRPLKDSWLVFPTPGHAVRLDRGGNDQDD